MEQTQMADFDREAPWAGWRWLRILALGTVTLLLSGYALGFTVGALQHEHGLHTDKVIKITVLALALLGCGLLLVREVRARAGEDPLTRQERLNRNLLVISGFLGVVIALVMAFTEVESGGDGFLSNDPLPPVVAILLILVTGLLVPAISIYWQRIIDEQEADATKAGALFAVYTYGIGAPVWWIAWRGGFVAPPDGFIIYFATMTVICAVWLWKKYR
jgi:uncharacterized integral membrane protein